MYSAQISAFKQQVPTVNVEELNEFVILYCSQYCAAIAVCLYMPRGQGPQI